MKMFLSTVLPFTLSFVVHCLILYGLFYVGSLIIMQPTSDTPIIINTITVSAMTTQNKSPKIPVKQTPNKPSKPKVQKTLNQMQPPKPNSLAVPQELAGNPQKDLSSNTTGSSNYPTQETPQTSQATTDLVPQTQVSSQVSPSNTDSIQATYIQQIARKINQNRFYPAPAKRLKQQGTVVISFTINKQGMITHSSIKTPSSSPLLNDAALRTLVKCKNFEAIPQTLALNTLDLEIPLEYNLTQ